MSLFDARIVQDRYEQNRHYYYPEMKKLIDDLIEDPARNISIPDNFIDKSLEDSSFLMSIVQKITIFFKKILNNLQYFFSSDYRNKYCFAVEKIKDACKKKVADISLHANKLMLAREAFDKSRTKVTSLKDKIRILEEKIISSKDKLEESLHIKNQIVQSALKINNKRTHAKSFKDRLCIASDRLKNDSEFASIKKLDPNFPLDKINDKVIEEYKNETFSSLFVQEIQQERINYDKLVACLDKNQQKLKAASAFAKEKGNPACIKNAAQEIDHHDLSNFFHIDFLEVPQEKAQGELIGKELQLERIRKNITENAKNKHLAILFSTLLDRLPENAIKYFTCNELGAFTLQLNKGYNIWISEAAIKGGAVILLGNETKGVIKGNFLENKIQFESGIENYLKESYVGLINPKFTEIEFRSKMDIFVWGTYCFQKGGKQKTYSSLEKDWKEGVLIADDYPGGYKGFLQDKLANC